jgi:hypothetical protein|tara:strand:+ start:93 stop:290 length:198 start_codon:yes stop_codon:yes gene_type:complete
MIIETEYTRAERKLKQEFINDCDNIIKDKKLSEIEKIHKLNCLMGIDYTYTYEYKIISKLMNEWR